MAELNLMPWRREDYRRKLIRWGIGAAGLCVGLISVAGWYGVSMQQRLQISIQKNQQLQQDIEQVRAKHRHQLLRLRQQQVSQEKPLHTKARSHQSTVVLQTKILPIHYAKATDLAAILRDKTNALLSRRGRIAVDQRTNILWLEDSELHMQKLQKFVRYFDTPARQILIEARLVNMNQETAHDLGVRLGLIAPSSANASASSESRPPPVPGGRMGFDLAARTLESGAASMGFTQAISIAQRLLDIELSALETQGKAKVIASPRLITSNQIAAVIEAGEDIPYQEFSLNGNTSIAFKKAALRLQVIPQITAQHELMMALTINQDADSGKRVQGVPIIATKSIETHILVQHGQTIILGGIYQQDQNRQTDQIPVLGGLPWIGDMFQRQHLRVRHESLLIFITPRILT